MARRSADFVLIDVPKPQNTVKSNLRFKFFVEA